MTEFNIKFSLIQEIKMHHYIIYAHPSHKSFTFKVMTSFIEGLKKAEHTYDVGDLYAMKFKSNLELGQYERETSGNPFAPIPEDVLIEQNKIQGSDVLVFVYPVWWSDCPAILKGWFDRVWTYGFAYFYDKDDQRKSLIKPKKAIVLCTAGHTNDDLEFSGIAQSMETIMIKDRLNNVGICDVEMEIFGGTMNAKKEHLNSLLNSAYNIGLQSDRR
jgi:NAD(P)H dehydrogenase (quinone)